MSLNLSRDEPNEGENENIDMPFNTDSVLDVPESFPLNFEVRVSGNPEDISFDLTTTGITRAVRSVLGFDRAHIPNIQQVNRRSRPAPQRADPPQPLHGIGTNNFMLLPEPHHVRRERANRRRNALLRPSRPVEEEPPRNTWPANWENHHDYMLWSCRGTVPVITDHLQALFRFDPPLEESFVIARLGGVNAIRQITFLKEYLPGETHSLQRAESRGVLYEANLVDPDVRGGFQNLDVQQLTHRDRRYLRPYKPPRGPPDWRREDDAHMLLYLGEHPKKFVEEYGWLFPRGLNLEFVSLRMAQIPHLGFTSVELMSAIDRFQVVKSMVPDYVTPFN